MKSKQFIADHKRVLRQGRQFYNPDTSLMPEAKYHTSKLKMLLVLPTPEDVKAVSSTKEAINDFILCNCPDVFLDIAFLPSREDIKYYDRENMPYAIGIITHLDASHFDMVGFSISVLYEVIGVQSMMKSFERCDKPIPLTWTERKDLPLGEAPLIYIGGITSMYGDVLFGELHDGRQSFIDFNYLGAVDKSDIVFQRLIEAKNTGKVTRHPDDWKVDMGADPERESKEYEPVVSVTTNQDYINSLFDLPFIYQPQAYKVVMDDKNQIIENTKINPLAQDYVRPYYPHVLSDDLSIARQVIDPSGSNCGSATIKISEGCSAGGACNFSVREGTLLWTDKGLIPIEKANPKKVQAIGLEPFKEIQKVRKESIHRVILDSGNFLEVSKEHLFVILEDGVLKEVEAHNLKEGDIIFRKLGNDANIKKETTTDELRDIEFIGMLHSPWTKYSIDHMNNVVIRFIDFLNPPLVQTGKYLIKPVSITQHHSGYEFKVKPEKFEKFKFDIEFFKGLSDKEIFRYLKGLFRVRNTTELQFEIKCESLERANFYSILLNYVGIDTRIRHSTNTVRIKSHHMDKFLINTDSVGTGEDRRASAYLPVYPELASQIRSLPEGDVNWKAIANADKISDLSLQKILATNPNIEMNQYYMHVANEILATDSVKSIMDIGIKDQTWDVVETTSNLCVYGSILSHQCAEGNVSGGWVEKSREQILYDAREAKRYSAGYKMKPYSFNMNYVNDYKGVMYDLLQIYPKVTFLNMRLEELGRDPDAMKIIKLSGANRIAAPIEGISPRIQNNLLNKCLTEEVLWDYMRYVMTLKMVDLKTGLIITGHEEDEDWQWLLDFNKKLRAEANAQNASFPIRYNVTPLVHYPLTPSEYFEKKSTRISYLGERWMNEEWYHKFKDENVRIKIHGFRHSTFIEQCVTDFGRFATAEIYDKISSKMTPVYSFRNVADELLTVYNDLVNPDYYFNVKDPETYISICHRINIELQGSYMHRAVNVAKEGVNAVPDIRCLRTYPGAPTKCHAKDFVKDPFKVYRDVKLDKNTLVGPYKELKGCERCSTPAQIKARTQREIIQTRTVEDVISAPMMRKAQSIKFVIQRLPDYDVLNPHNTAHTFVSKLLQHSDKLLDMYHSVAFHSHFWQAEAQVPYVFDGYQVVQTIWGDTKAIDEVRRIIPEVNKELKSVKIVAAYDEQPQENIRVKDYNIFRFESTLPYILFSESVPNYKGQIRILKDDLMQEVIDPSLVAPTFQNIGKTVGYFAIPCRHNPVSYLRGFLSVKRTSVDAILQSTTFTSVMTARETRFSVCRHCGEEPAVISMITNKVMPLGINCLPKALLSNEIKKMQ